MAELIPMTRYSHLLETRTGLRMMIFGAGVLAVLVLACAGTAAGATWVVDDDSGAGVGRQIVGVAA